MNGVISLALAVAALLLVSLGLHPIAGIVLCIIGISVVAVPVICRKYKSWSSRA